MKCEKQRNVMQLLERLVGEEIGAVGSRSLGSLSPPTRETQGMQMVGNDLILIGCQCAGKPLDVVGRQVRCRRIFEQDFRGKILRHQRDMEFEREIVGKPIKATQGVVDESRKHEMSYDDAAERQSVVVGEQRRPFLPKHLFQSRLGPLRIIGRVGKAGSEIGIGILEVGQIDIDIRFERFQDVHIVVGIGVVYHCGMETMRMDSLDQPRNEVGIM